MLKLSYPTYWHSPLELLIKTAMAFEEYKELDPLCEELKKRIHEIFMDLFDALYSEKHGGLVVGSYVYLPSGFVTRKEYNSNRYYYSNDDLKVIELPKYKPPKPVTKVSMSKYDGILIESKGLGLISYLQLLRAIKGRKENSGMENKYRFDVLRAKSEFIYHHNKVLEMTKIRKFYSTSREADILYMPIEVIYQAVRNLAVALSSNSIKTDDDGNVTSNQYWVETSEFQKISSSRKLNGRVPVHYLDDKKLPDLIKLCDRYNITKDPESYRGSTHGDRDNVLRTFLIESVGNKGREYKSNSVCQFHYEDPIIEVYNSRYPRNLKSGLAAFESVINCLKILSKVEGEVSQIVNDLFGDINREYNSEEPILEDKHIHRPNGEMVDENISETLVMNNHESTKLSDIGNNGVRRTIKSTYYETSNTIILKSDKFDYIGKFYIR